MTLDALVHPATGRSWLCTIRDFCSGGMLLVEKEAVRGRRSQITAAKGDLVGIHFTVPLGRGDQHFRLEGNVVRTINGAVGISFPGGLADNVTTALLEFANHSVDFGDDGEEESSTTRITPPPQRGGQAAAQREPVQQSPGRASQAPSAQRPQPGSPARPQAQGPANRAPQRPGQPQPKARITPRQAEQIIAECRKRVVRVLPEMVNAFFDYMDNELLLLARSARSNDVQNEYFSAMNLLEKSKKGVGQTFANDVLRQIDHPQKLEAVLERRRARENSGGGDQQRVRLSLVNTDEFEDWLAVANLIVRAERLYNKYLVELQARMGMLVDSWAHNEVNPLGPAVFARAFDDAIRALDLNKEIREKAYSGFETTIVPLFRRLYTSVTEMLEATRLFPSLDDDFISATPVRRVETRPTPAQAKKEEAKKEEAKKEEAGKEEAGKDEAEPKKEETPQNAQDAAPEAPPPPPRRRTRDQPFMGERGGPRRRTAPRAPGIARQGAAARGGKAQQTLRKLYSTVQTLLDESMAEEFDEEIAEADLFQLNEVQEALSLLQHQRVENPAANVGRSVREQLIEALGGETSGRRISPQARQAMAVVENMMGAVDRDALLPQNSRDWIRQLDITLNRIAALDNDFLDEGSDHPALELINQLAHLGASDSSAVRRTVDRVVSNIVDSYDGDDSVFERAMEELNPLVERQTRAYAGNVQRAVRASEGQQVLKNAQSAVVREVENRLGGQRIPEVIMRLLVPGWRNLLVNTHLRQGQSSPEWKRYLQVLEQLLMQMDPRIDPTQAPGYIPPDDLLREIESGLDSIAYEPGQRAPLMRALKQMIETGGSTEGLSIVELPASGLAGTLGLAALQEREAKRQQILEAAESVPDWDRWHARVASLHVGEWLEIKSDAGDPQVAIVAWVSEEGDNFVFVDRRGVKSHELMGEELTQLLVAGDARILEESDLPLTDRASHRMLQDMHNQLTHQATHDELTGLGNRKAFEREVEQALATARKRDVQYMVAYVDLDQFKVINSTSGYDAGDALLGAVARILEKPIPGVSHFVARLGGNEFGVLVNNCNVNDGQQIVRAMCDGLKKQRFEWKGTQFTLTASAGCVAIDSKIDDSSTVLRAADAARYAAKEAGRDRVQLYRPDDLELTQRHGVMEFVSQIDQALEENRFVLNCQKISPIDDPNEHAHYEILLTVLDANGEPMPPQDFIVAAETYNRMGAIDRWVIRNSFKWIAANILKLGNLGAFSINVSGNSLNEDDFMDFVLEQFRETKLPTSKICFEITETAAISSLAGAIDFMNKMKVIGVQFSLDDFGSGLSSYSYLRDLPVDYLKIDGIFVKDILSSPNDFAVVKSINEIGHFMGKKTIAEYVENEEVLEKLREIGVDFAQGYGIEKKRVLAELV